MRALALLLLLPGLSLATEANINAVLGGKLLDRDDWDPVEDQGSLGVQVDVRPGDWPVAIAINVIASSAYDRRTVAGTGTVETYGGVTELQLGLAGLLPLPGNTTLFAGGGASFASAMQEVWTASSERVDYGYGVGGWAHAGAFWTINRFNIGFAGGWSIVPLEIEDRDIDAGGWRVGLLLGGHIR
jgi:hypothetical protein